MSNRFGDTPPNTTFIEKENTNLPLNQENILPLIYQQHDNFKEIRAYVNSKKIQPGNLMLPQTLKMIDTDISNKDFFIVECINYLDIISMYSLVTYGDSEIFINKTIDFIIEKRSVPNFNVSLLKETMNDFYFNSKDEARAFLHSNKIFVAIYFFSLLDLMFYTPES